MRVLIADDNRDSAESLAVLLRIWGFVPVIVHDGQAALAFLREAAVPTLALLDWVMPGINGIDICREIRKEVKRPYTYVILVTGHGGKDHMVDGLTAGADDYLIKPVDPHELRARLNTARRILELHEQLLATQRLLHEQATRDSLTGLWNRTSILEILAREATASEALPQLFIEQTLDLLCAHLIRAHSSLGAFASPKPRRGLADWQVRRVSEFMNEHLDRDLSLDQLAAVVRLSRFHFCTAFRQATGQTPYQWLMALRMDRARDLLRNPKMPIVQVALAAGYETPSAFAAAFRRMEGVSPSEFRRAL